MISAGAPPVVAATALITCKAPLVLIEKDEMLLLPVFVTKANLLLRVTSIQHASDWPACTGPLLSVTVGREVVEYEDTVLPLGTLAAASATIIKAVGCTNCEKSNPNGVVPADVTELPGCATPPLVTGKIVILLV